MTQVTSEPALITFPARPVNGGRLETAPPKVGPWICQPKIKDWRGVVHCPTKRIWNRHGKLMSISQQLDDALEVLRASPFLWLDVGVMERQNQLLRNSIIVFDMITEAKTQSARYDFLEHHFRVLPSATYIAAMPESYRTGSVFLIDSYPIKWGDQKSSKIIYAKLMALNRDLGGNPDDATDMKNFYEGIVCKRTDKPYPVQLLSPTKETPWMIKHRFDQ